MAIEHEYTPITSDTDVNNFTPDVQRRVTTAKALAMTCAILVLLVIVDQVTIRNNTKSNPTTFARTRIGHHYSIHHHSNNASNHHNTTNHLFNTCTSTLRGSECDVTWPKKRCVVCCTLESYSGRCKADSKSNVCAKCCKLMLPSSTCSSYPQRRPCRDCCARLVNSWSCRVAGGSRCRKCCDMLRDSRFCRNPVGFWARACERCKS